jgi:hypothetical protein
VELEREDYSFLGDDVMFFVHTTDLLEGNGTCVLRAKECLLGRKWRLKFPSKRTYEVCLKSNDTESIRKEFVPQEQTVNEDYYSEVGARDSAVFKALRYYSDGPGIDFRWCHCIFQ